MHSDVSLDRGPISPTIFLGARVLVVEDDPINQEVIQELLEYLGLLVELADDGIAALERARNGFYDLVFMDIQMPRLDGLQATREIRKLSGWEQIPIIAITANAFVEDRQNCIAAGMNDYLTKPVDPDQLLVALDKWLPKCKREIDR
ncbi:MAG: response regulator [Pseudomonadota bacterium]